MTIQQEKRACFVEGLVHLPNSALIATTQSRLCACPVCVRGVRLHLLSHLLTSRFLLFVSDTQCSQRKKLLQSEVCFGRELALSESRFSGNDEKKALWDCRQSRPPLGGTGFSNSSFTTKHSVLLFLQIVCATHSLVLFLARGPASPLLFTPPHHRRLP